MMPAHFDEQWALFRAICEQREMTYKQQMIQ